MIVKAKIDKIMKADEAAAFTIARAIPIEKGFSQYLNAYGNFSILGTGYFIENMEYEFEYKQEKQWEKNKYGYTLKYSSYKQIIPDTSIGLTSYLENLKGIGPSLARKIVKHFGPDTLDILEKSPYRLMEVSGVGEKKYKEIKKFFKRDKDLEEVAKLLGTFGISSKKIGVIYGKLGKDSIRIINENPYVLCDAVEGISFNTSDAIARKMGFSKDNFYRLSSGIIHILRLAANSNGHLFLYEEQLYRAFARFFQNIGSLRFEEILSTLEKQGRIKRDDNKDKIYLTSYYEMEEYVAMKICSLNCSNSSQIQNLPLKIKNVEKKNNIVYDDMQKQAISIINSGSAINIITGGPGTGKTTIIKAIIGIQKEENKDSVIMLAAPTGRASKRMSEATNYPAKTIHRLLEYDGFAKRFNKNKSDPLNCDLLIIDESSMIDISLFCSLINAITIGTKVLFVGDVDQLPPVKAGYVFRDMINSNTIPVVKLNKIYRQGEDSIIVSNAQNIKNGEVKIRNKGNYFETYLSLDIPAIQNTLKKLFFRFLNEENKKNNKENSLFQVQILSPMKKGPLGTNNINALIQNAYNPAGKNKKEMIFENKYGKDIFRTNDKVMQLNNNYEKEVFNGDIGIITKVGYERIAVTFEDGREVFYDKEEIKENLKLAYACTVHKSQGSEFNKVIMLCCPEFRQMNQRNLFYTGITRAKETVALIGDKKSISSSITTTSSVVRNSKTTERLVYYYNLNTQQAR